MNSICVSIIIVTYNSEKVIVPCIEALINQKYQKYEIIIVDNDSADETVKIVDEYPISKFIKLKQNKGFTGGNIEGLRYAKGKYIALLNPDTVPSPVWLENLVEEMDIHADVGICASKLIVYDTDFIDSAGDGCTSTGRGFKRGEGEDISRYTKKEYVFGACGGAMLIRKKVIDSIGFFDDDFFLIHEDTDFNFRVQLAGWKILFVPEAVVYHKVRSSIGHMSDIAIYYSIRNARYVWMKNMPLPLMLKYFHHQLIQEIGTFFYFALKCNRLKIYLRANFDSFKSLPLMFRKRKNNLKNKVVMNSEIENLLTPIWKSEIIRNKVKKLLY